MLAEHLHHAPDRCKVVVERIGLGHPGAIGGLEHVLPAVRVVLIRTEQAEVTRLHVQLHHVAEESTHEPRGLRCDGAGRRHRDGVVAEIWQAQISEEDAAIGVPRGRARPVRAGAGPRRQKALRTGNSSSTLRGYGRGRGSLASPRSAPGARASSPRRACRRPPSGRSSLWACAARSAASAGVR